MRYDRLIKNLGRRRTGTSCPHIKRLSEMDETVLEKFVEGSVDWTRMKTLAS